jgi:hypothetical protein
MTIRRVAESALLTWGMLIGAGRFWKMLEKRWWWCRCEGNFDRIFRSLDVIKKKIHKRWKQMQELAHTK